MKEMQATFYPPIILPPRPKRHFRRHAERIPLKDIPSFKFPVRGTIEFGKAA